MAWHSIGEYACEFSPKVLIVVAIILLSIFAHSGSVNSHSVEAAQNYLAKGAWNGKMSGIGTLMMSYNISLVSNMSGTFSGNTSRGEWSGKYYAIYRVERSLLDDIGFIKGNYTWNIDNKGVLSGEVNTKVTGLLVGDWRLQLQGSTSDSRRVKGTWSGIFTPTQFSYGGVTPVSTIMKLEGSGEFEGTLEPVESPTPTPTTPSVSPTENATSLPQPPPTAPSALGSQQYLPYAAAAIVAAVVIAGLYVARTRSISKKAADRMKK